MVEYSVVFIAFTGKPEEPLLYEYRVLYLKFGFCLLVMIRSVDLHLNRHLIENYSVKAFIAGSYLIVTANTELNLQIIESQV